MSVNTFLLDVNKQMVWDLIQDEFILNEHSQETVQRISDVFNTNIKGFYESEKNKSVDLFDLNKKYILTILGYINNNILKPKQKPNIVEEKYYTHEDIQNDKRSQFDKELNVKKSEFTNAITQKIPPVPNFSDTVDEPIVEMEEAVRKMVEQRKYDIDQIPLLEKMEQKQKGDLRSPFEIPVVEQKSTRGGYGGSALTVEQKSTRGVYGGTTPAVDQKSTRGVYGGSALTVEQKSTRGVYGGSAPVYIKIDKENIIDNRNDVIDLEPKKQITWSQTNDIIEQNIFNKLKTLKPETSNSFQQELDELKIKMEVMNANINKILQMLTYIVENPLLEKVEKNRF
jgi:hypothetical protein